MSRNVARASAEVKHRFGSPWATFSEGYSKKYSFVSRTLAYIPHLVSDRPKDDSERIPSLEKTRRVVWLALGFARKVARAAAPITM